MAKIDKARFWTAVLYQENMRADWETAIGDIVQLPYAYCCHTQDKDSKSEHRKDHVHVMLAFPNTTTYKHAMSVFGLLSAEGKKALNKIEAVINVRNMYDYLIHDTETCKKQGKELYDKSARITGNNFDIGAYEQLGTAEKNAICKELCLAVKERRFTNFMDFFDYVIETYEDINYFETVKTYSGLFEKLTRANYQKWERGDFAPKTPPQELKCESVTSSPPQNLHEDDTPTCCPECGSVDVQKRGKTASDKQRWLCKDCGKSFV